MNCSLVGILSNKITAVDRDRIPSRSSYDNNIFCATLFWGLLKRSSVKLTKLLVIYLNTPWKSFNVIKLTVRTTCFKIPFVTFWKLIRCHAVTPRWLDDAQEYIQSVWSKRRDYLLFGTRNHGRGCLLLRKLPFSKIIWRLALGF